MKLCKHYLCAASPTYRTLEMGLSSPTWFHTKSYIEWKQYIIILTIMWLFEVLCRSRDHQSDPIVTKAFQNPDLNCPSIYTQSKHCLSTIGSKLHHRKTIWPILKPMKFLELILSNLILTQFYHRFTPPCGKPTRITGMCSNSTIFNF